MLLTLRIESWIWYAVAMFVVGCRFVSRSMLFGSLLRLKIDDWIMIFGICTYTTLVVCMNIVANKSSNLIPPGVSVETMSQEEIDDRVLGSKLVFVVELMQCFNIWTLKTTLLILYYRVTFRLPQNLWVKLLAVYVAVGFVVMMSLYLGVWCQPLNNYWAVPTPNPQCDTATNHLITNAVLNISSDVIMLAIGFSLALKSKLPLKRKMIVNAIFALGIFIIIAAALNKYYSFSNPFGSMWTFWYIREASTAMIVANLPFCWTLVRKVFHVGAFNENNSSEVRYHTTRSARGRKEQGPGPGGKRVHVLHGQGSSNNSTDSGTTMVRQETKLDHAMETIKPSMRKWRERGVFGRDDVEALGSDSDEEYIIPARRRPTVNKPVDRRLSMAQSPHREGIDHSADLVLHDVGNLGEANKPSYVFTPPGSPPTSPEPAMQNMHFHKYQMHRRAASADQNQYGRPYSGHQSLELKRPDSASGAPETVASHHRDSRPTYYSGRAKAKNKRLSGDPS